MKKIFHIISFISFIFSIVLIYKDYFLLSFLFLIFSSINILFSKIKKKIFSIDILMIYFFLFIIIFFVEAILLFQNQSLENKTFKIAKNQGVEFDQRNRFEVYKDEKKNKNISVAIGGANYLDFNKDYNHQDLILSGKSNVLNIFCNESGYMTYYSSDRYGFNNPDFVWNKNDNNVILVGDSTVHGACQNRKKHCK